MNFEDIYFSAPDSLRLKFLDAIIWHNDKLKKEFILFKESSEQKPDVISDNAFVEIIDKTRSIYKHLFEGVNIENPDWEMYHPPHLGYIPDYEAYQYASEQEFEAIFENFVSKAINIIIEQRPDELIAMLTGLYKSIQNAGIEDDIGSFNDINEYLLDEFGKVTHAIVEKLRLCALSENRIKNAFIKFFGYCNKEYPGNEYFAKHFEPLLITLAEKSKNTENLLEIYDQSGIGKNTMPELTLFLYKRSGKHDTWLLSALQFYRDSEPVAKELLTYYYETNKEAFVSIARELFPANKYSWSRFLQNYISPQLDRELYVKVFIQLIISSHEIDYYHKVKPYLNDSDYNQLIKELKLNKTFLVLVYEANQSYSEIKTLVEENTSHWDFDKLIAPILTIYPDYCFKRIKNQAVKTLETERGRDIYMLIARWLKLCRQIPGYQHDTIILIQQVYTHKPNLPALKDEMRKAGLVS
ncbi:MAG: hypothetical protein JW798_17150 [Prolixibacteraceae bacterium]|nr:hypothetical protein [Prolixibacteraceae bacterium]